MRIVLFGSSVFALPVLEALNDSNYNFVSIFTQPPRKSGRGQLVSHNCVANRAIQLNIDCQFPENVNEEASLKKLKDLRVDVAIVASYGQILSRGLLQIPKFGFLNLHPSLLPRWRGASPIESAILAGDKETGICTIKMVEELDAGPILVTERVTIDPGYTASKLAGILSQIGARQVLRVLGNISKFKEVPQDEGKVTYASKISKNKARINWNLPAKSVDCFIRAFSSRPGAYCLLNGKRVKFFNSKVLAGFSNLEPGLAFFENNKKGEGISLIIACGSGAIGVNELQIAGKKLVKVADFIRGYKEKIKFD